MVVKVENKVKELRKAKKLSQDEVAKFCNVSRQTINAIENNKYDPSLYLAFSLAKYLDVPIDELFKFDIEKKNKPKTF
ncbi:MAG: helix-turn-helix transcriptional regulator [Firmicutes bacterium]|nr:helix-turn-helix transcriptional regulator [Bacillota bacterium]